MEKISFSVSDMEKKIQAIEAALDRAAKEITDLLGCPTDMGHECPNGTETCYLNDLDVDEICKCWKAHFIGEDR